MTDEPLNFEVEAVDRAIALVESALEIADSLGFVYAAIDLSSALDKLCALKSGNGAIQ